MRSEWLGVLMGAIFALLLASAARAAESPPEAAEAVQDQLGHDSVGERVMPDARDWRLDPAIFTELKPFAAPEQAILLPEDQREE